MKDDFDNKFGSPVVDFDFFDFDDASEVGLTTDMIHNKDVAAKIALALIANTSQDDIQFTTEFDPKNSWETTAGTGGSGMAMCCATQAHQRAILASHFATYALGHYESCYLGKPDYHCLCSLVLDLESWQWSGSGSRQRHQKNLWRLVKRTCEEFEERYAKEDPTFHFQYIKTREDTDHGQE